MEEIDDELSDPVGSFHKIDCGWEPLDPTVRHNTRILLTEFALLHIANHIYENDLLTLINQGKKKIAIVCSIDNSSVHFPQMAVKLPKKGKIPDIGDTMQARIIRTIEEKIQKNNPQTEVVILPLAEHMTLHRQTSREAELANTPELENIENHLKDDWEVICLAGQNIPFLLEEYDWIPHKTEKELQRFAEEYPANPIAAKKSSSKAPTTIGSLNWLHSNPNNFSNVCGRASAIQAKDIWDNHIEPLLRQGKKVGLLFYTNNQQAMYIERSYNSNKILKITGTNQAVLFAEMLNLMHCKRNRLEDKYRNLHDRVRILPIATSMTDSENDTPDECVKWEHISRDLNNIEDHIKRGYHVVGLAKINEKHEFAGFSTEGGVSKNWDKKTVMCVVPRSRGGYDDVDATSKIHKINKEEISQQECVDKELEKLLEKYASPDYSHDNSYYFSRRRKKTGSFSKVDDELELEYCKPDALGKIPLNEDELATRLIAKRRLERYYGIFEGINIYENWILSLIGWGAKIALVRSVHQDDNLAGEIVELPREGLLPDLGDTLREKIIQDIGKGIHAGIKYYLELMVGDEEKSNVLYIKTSNEGWEYRVSNDSWQKQGIITWSQLPIFFPENFQVVNTTKHYLSNLLDTTLRGEKTHSFQRGYDFIPMSELVNDQRLQLGKNLY